MNIDEKLIANQYRIIEPLTQGGFAVDYKVVDTTDEKTYLARVYDFDKAGKEVTAHGRNEFKAMARKEAELQASLDHPGIQKTYRFLEQDDKQVVLIKEFVEGAMLEEMVSDCKLSEAEVLRVGLDLSDALSYLHSNNTTHNYLDTSAVKLNLDGKPVIVGRDKTSRNLESIADLKQEPQPGYVPTDGTGFSKDSYSVAMIMAYMVTGHKPDEINMKRLRKDYKVSKKLVKVLKKATSPKASKRYSDIEQFSNDLFSAKRTYENNQNRSLLGKIALGATKGILGTIAALTILGVGATTWIRYSIPPLQVNPNWADSIMHYEDPLQPWNHLIADGLSAEELEALGKRGAKKLARALYKYGALGNGFEVRYEEEREENGRQHMKFNGRPISAMCTLQIAPYLTFNGKTDQFKELYIDFECDGSVDLFGLQDPKRDFFLWYLFRYFPPSKEVAQKNYSKFISRIDLKDRREFWDATMQRIVKYFENQKARNVIQVRPDLLEHITEFKDSVSINMTNRFEVLGVSDDKTRTIRYKEIISSDGTLKCDFDLFDWEAGMDLPVNVFAAQGLQYQDIGCNGSIDRMPRKGDLTAYRFVEGERFLLKSGATRNDSRIRDLMKRLEKSIDNGYIKIKQPSRKEAEKMMRQFKSKAKVNQRRAKWKNWLREQ